MKLNYFRDEKIPDTLDVKAGDIIQTGLSSYKVQNIKVLAVIDEAILTESAINPAWSNRVYSAQEIYNLGCTIIHKEAS